MKLRTHSLSVNAYLILLGENEKEEKHSMLKFEKIPSFAHCTHTLNSKVACKTAQLIRAVLDGYYERIICTERVF